MNTHISHPALARWDDLPSSAPLLGATHAVVRVDTATPCGTDLHLLKTEAPIITDGRIFGDEVVGTVVQVGSDVHTVHVGDRLLVSCSSARGHHGRMRKWRRFESWRSTGRGGRTLAAVLGGHGLQCSRRPRNLASH